MTTLSLARLRSDGQGFTEIEIALDSLEFFRELDDGLVTLLWCFRQSLRQDSLQIEGEFRLALARKARLSVKDRVHCVDAIVMNERGRARQHFAQHHSERKHVAATVDALAQ